jgi:hypothetical protein
MKVGDLVKWHSQGHDPDGSLADNGLVVQLSRTGWHSLCALVLFEDGAVEWIPTGGLEVDNESI